MRVARRDRLRSQLAEHGLDALLVTTLPNVRYLTGFTGSAGEVLITADGDGDVFVTDGRYEQQSAAEVPDLARMVADRPGWLPDRVVAGTRLALEADTVSWRRAESIRRDVPATVVAAPPLVEGLRTVKDRDEVAALRAACAAADAAFQQLTTWLAPGITERQAAQRLERAVVDAGAQERSFATIFAAGEHTAVPHHQPTDRVLRTGDLVKVDFGGVAGGYHSDMTRMLSLGPPIGELAEILQTVRAAQAAGVAAVRDGATTADVDDACRSLIADAGHERQFVHGTGHGVGLQIHERPFLRPDRPRPPVAAAPSVTLRSGMTVTVEPGVYVPGVGGVRIEDTLVVTSTGADVLTRTPKDLVVL